MGSGLDFLSIGIDAFGSRAEKLHSDRISALIQQPLRPRCRNPASPQRGRGQGSEHCQPGYQHGAGSIDEAKLIFRHAPFVAGRHAMASVP